MPEGGAGTGESGLGGNGGPGPHSLGLVTSAATWQSPWSSATTVSWHHADSTGKWKGGSQKNLDSMTSPVSC